MRFLKVSTYDDEIKGYRDVIIPVDIIQAITQITDKHNMQDYPDDDISCIIYLKANPVFTRPYLYSNDLVFELYKELELIANTK